MATTAGRKRRQQLIEAALTALHDRGLSQLRIKDVAEAAGVSTGTIHYHFADLDELLVAIHELAVERFVEGRRIAIRDIADARAKVAALADSGIPEDETDMLVAALYEFAPLVRRNPIHRALMRALAQQQVALYASAFEVGQAQGHFTFRSAIDDVATNAVALEDAYGLYIWALPSQFTAAMARHLLRVHLAEVTQCPELETRSTAS